MIAEGNEAKYSNEKRRHEVELIQPFHDGTFKRCPLCGRSVFMPCLACALEVDGHVNDPVDTMEEEPLRIQLEGNQRQRYEYCRLEKYAEIIKREEREKKNGSY